MNKIFGKMKISDDSKVFSFSIEKKNMEKNFLKTCENPAFGGRHWFLPRIPRTVHLCLGRIPVSNTVRGQTT